LLVAIIDNAATISGIDLTTKAMASRRGDRLLPAWGGCDERRDWRVRTGEEGDMHALRAGLTYAGPDSLRHVKARMAASWSQRVAVPRYQIRFPAIDGDLDGFSIIIATFWRRLETITSVSGTEHAAI
jgi:hypothetical protein